MVFNKKRMKELLDAFLPKNGHKWVHDDPFVCLRHDGSLDKEKGYCVGHLAGFVLGKATSRVDAFVHYNDGRVEIQALFNEETLAGLDRSLVQHGAPFAPFGDEPWYEKTPYDVLADFALARFGYDHREECLEAIIPDDLLGEYVEEDMPLEPVAM